jgi:hypothetical protein
VINTELRALGPCKRVIRETIGATQPAEIGFCTGGCEDMT